MSGYLGLIVVLIGSAFIGGAVSAWFLKVRGAGHPLMVPMDIKVNLKLIQHEGYLVISHDTELKSSELSNELVMAWLDREGMVAVPKGFDFGKTLKAKS